MALPRVFISSTYYDLQYVRNDLEEFIKGMGYEPVMHDRGGITYVQVEETLEQSCYSELLTCDIVVCIIGGKFGTESSAGDYSITMRELLGAVKENKYIYIFVQDDVYGENATYIANRETGSFIPVRVDNIKIHEFISEIKANIKNHPIQGFKAVANITGFLKSQFAGLFQRLLSQKAAQTESKTYYDIKEIADEIKQLTKDFAEEKDGFFNKFHSTIYAMNPIITIIGQKIGLSKSSFFATDIEALKEFLRVIDFDFDEDVFSEWYEFTCKLNTETHKLSVRKDAFDEQGRLRRFGRITNTDEWVQHKIEKHVQYTHNTTSVLDDDDLPF